MTFSAVNVTDPATDPASKTATGPASVPFTRQIEVRLATPTPRVSYKNGKAVREPLPDMERIAALVGPDLTVALQSLYGEQTEVKVTLARSPGIRLTGTFTDKAEVIKAVVGDLLNNIFEHLEASD